MKKIIVTGGLGFIGSNLIEILLKRGYYVLNLDKVSYSSNFYNTNNYKKNKKYKFLKIDINSSKIEQIINKLKPDCIFNLAAESHVDRSIESPRPFIESNINGVFNLLEAFKKKKLDLFIFQLMRFLEIFSQVDQMKTIRIDLAHLTQHQKHPQIILFRRM